MHHAAEAGQQGPESTWIARQFPQDNPLKTKVLDRKLPALKAAENVVVTSARQEIGQVAFLLRISYDVNRWKVC